MDLALKDLKLLKYKKQIDENRQILIENYKHLKKNTKANQFLQGVLDDYKKHFDYIIKEKEKQYNTLNMISNYLNKISEEVKMSDTLIHESEIEQGKILNELNKLKLEIDELSVVKK